MLGASETALTDILAVNLFYNSWLFMGPAAVDHQHYRTFQVVFRLI